MVQVRYMFVDEQKHALLKIQSHIYTQSKRNFEQQAG